MFKPCHLGTFFLLAAACAPASDGNVETLSTREPSAPVRGESDVDTPAARVVDVAPGAPQRPAAPAPRRGPASMADEADPHGLSSEDVVDGSSGVASMTGGSSSLRYRARLLPELLPLVAFEFVLNNTGSGFQEKFLLQVPSTPPATPAPLLVVFHKYGTGHGDVLNTDFPYEANARGWYLLSPLAGSQRNFGGLVAQINTRAAIDLVLHLLSTSIDRNRIYGVGFSMGGGALASYAARNVDTDRPMFAAICDHTGSVSLAHTYYFEPDDDDQDDNMPAPGSNLEPKDVLENVMGGTPTDALFNYQRFSTIDLDPLTSTVIDPASDMSRNLAHVPTLVHVANFDPNQYLYDQTIAFDAHVRGYNPANQLLTSADAQHRWDTLDYAYVCNWFALRSLTLPSTGHVLADEEGRFFYFTIQQETGGTFTPFRFRWDLPTRTLEVSQSENLWVLSVDLADLGLTLLSGDVTFDLSTSDGSGDKIQLTNVGTAPSAVTRDGVAETFNYDPIALTVNFTESDAAPHTWVVSFP